METENGLIIQEDDNEVLTEGDILQNVINEEYGRWKSDGRENLVMNVNSRSGTASLSGEKDRVQYTETFTIIDGGAVRMVSKINKNVSKKSLQAQIKALKKQGFKQTQIAMQLGISQATVSNYLKKGKKKKNKSKKE